jgi:uncharacterized protein YndB with AHSA1/START domain
MMQNIALKVTTPSDREIVLSREFDAPRRAVWDTMTKPELLKRWLFGPPGWVMTVCETDVRIGGAFRHVWRHEDGRELAMRGEYREVVVPERIVRTETFELGCDPQSGEQVGTLVLKERVGGGTSLTLTLRFPSKEARDATVASGMEHGVAAGYDRIDGLLASMGFGR